MLGKIEFISSIWCRPLGSMLDYEDGCVCLLYRPLATSLSSVRWCEPTDCVYGNTWNRLMNQRPMVSKIGHEDTAKVEGGTPSNNVHVS